MNDKIEITEQMLYNIISRAMANALKDDWLTPEEFTKQTLKAYYDKVEKDLKALLNSDKKKQL